MNSVDLPEWVVLMGAIGIAAQVFTACSTTARDQAITSCRQAGYLSAVENAGVWYCFKDPLALPKPIPPPVK